MQYKEQIAHNKLREVRQTLGLRQQDVAELLGFDITDRISHWERGTAIPSIVNLFRLSNIYKILPHELYADLFIQTGNELQNKNLKSTS